MKSRGHVALTTLLMLLGLVLLSSASVAQGEPAIPSIGATEFGMSFINSAEELRSEARIQRGVATGAKLDRFPLYWNYIERSPGYFDWNRQDAALRGNESQGLGTLAILLGTPGHYYPSALRAQQVVEMPQVGGGPVREALQVTAQAEEMLDNGCDVQGTPAPRELYAPIFSDGSDEPGSGKLVNPGNHWAHFVGQAVQRYRPGGTAGLNVRYWEVWNEPDLCHFWGGTSEEYARLLKVAYLVIKNYDPQATVLWGGLALYGPKYDNGRHFLNELVSSIRHDQMAYQHNGFFDAAAIHQYSNVVHGYHYTYRTRNALAGTGWEGKPIWVTESGVPVCGSYPGPDCPSPYRATAEDQAAYIWQNIAYTRIAGNNAPIFHFQLHDDGGNECRPAPPADAFGLVTNEPNAQCVPHNAEPRLSYTAYQLATRYLSDTELLWADIQNGIARRVAFYHPATKERRTLVWAIDASDAVVTLPAAGGSARRISLDGSETTITPVDGSYHISVPRATNQSQPGSSAYTVGGRPYLLIEQDTLPPVGWIGELPLVSQPSFEVSWGVSDSGSGVASVKLWVQRDEEPWGLWLSDQPSTGSQHFNGEMGHRYRFFVQGLDRAGNLYNTFAPMAETFVGSEQQKVRITGTVLNMRGERAPWASVSIGPAGAFTDAAGNFALSPIMGRWDVAVRNHVLRHGQLLLGDTSFTLLLPPERNAVTNGDFENGVAGWRTGGSSSSEVEELSSTHDHFLRLASAFVPSPGVPGTEGSTGGNATILQTLQVPTGRPHLAFLYKVESEETDGGNGACSNPAALHDKFEIIIARDGYPADYIYCQEIGGNWRYRFLDLSKYAGQQVTLIFNVYESSPNRRTRVLLDLVNIGESPTLTRPQPHYLPVIGR
ncbi:MAG: hypothetical protein M3220_20215 [Chloroflexota bacterium]|nr:hypothetical protein [Chloroflexota bacterium]